MKTFNSYVDVASFVNTQYFQKILTFKQSFKFMKEDTKLFLEKIRVLRIYVVKFFTFLHSSLEVKFLFRVKLGS